MKESPSNSSNTAEYIKYLENMVAELENKIKVLDKKIEFMVACIEELK